MDLNLHTLNTASVLFRVFLAFLCGGIIGLERGSKGRAAGFRTYMLVCIGAALVMLTNQFIYEEFGTSDPARLGAQVISGIGFLGVGTIIVTRQHQVIGLTTAAGLWASACLGLAIGIGFYAGAIIGSVFIFIIITTMHQLGHKVMSVSRDMEIYLELEEGVPLSVFLRYAQEHRIFILHVEAVRPKYVENGNIATMISLKLPERRQHLIFIEQLRSCDFVDYVEEI